MHDDEGNQGEPCNKEDGRRNQVWSNMIDPPAADRWNGKHKRGEQDAFAIRDRKAPLGCREDWIGKVTINRTEEIGQ